MIINLSDRIVKELQDLKKIQIDKEFTNDLGDLFFCLDASTLRVVYNDIRVRSVSCLNEKDLRKFEIELSLLNKFPEALEIASRINRNCKNNYYKIQDL